MRTLLGMQYGGSVPQQLQDGGVSSGLAYLRRGKARKKAYDKARDEEARLIEKRKKGGFWGSLGGLGGGLLGAALVGSGLGIPLALAAGLGTAGGRYLGSRAGYGKDFEVKDNIMYGEEAGLEDIGAAGESYESGMGQEAILSGVKAGLMAGLAPGGGIYGKTSKWAEGLKGAEALAPVADVVTADTGAVFNEATGMYGDMPIEELNLDFDNFSNLPSPPPAPNIPPVPEAPLVPDSENFLLTHGATKDELARMGAGSVDMGITTPSVPVPESPVVSDSLIGLTDDFTMPIDTSVVAPSYADALANRGQYQGLINQFFQQYSPDQRSAENWMRMFQQPQIAGAMHGGVIKESPRTLLGFVG